jgi:hypothetical protein
MNNVHDDEPVVFETRWAMSYLRGPLTRNQIKLLMDPVKNSAPSLTTSPVSAAASTDTNVEPPPKTSKVTATATAPHAARPVLPPETPQLFAPTRSARPADHALFYRPEIVGAAEIHFTDTKTGVNLIRYVMYSAPISDGPAAMDWGTASEILLKISDLQESPSETASYGDLPSIAARPGSYTLWKREFSTWLTRTQQVDLWMRPSLRQYSRVNESERDFRVRLLQQAREQRDEATERLRQKYAPRFASLQEQVRRAQVTVEREREQVRQQQMETALSFGTTILGGFLGRKRISAGSLGRARSTASRASRSMKEARDVERAQGNVEAAQNRLRQLEADFNADTAALAARIDPSTELLETASIRPTRTDVSVQLLALGWFPYWQGPDGNLKEAW